MKDHFRFSTAYWHTFCGTGGDPFGPGTKSFPWENHNDPIKRSLNRLDAAFEFFSKLGTEFYCFHDRDMAPEGSTVKESKEILKMITLAAKEKQLSILKSVAYVQEKSRKYTRTGTIKIVPP